MIIFTRGQWLDTLIHMKQVEANSATVESQEEPVRRGASNRRLASLSP